MAKAISHQEALIYVMVTMSAVDRAMSDHELQRIGHIVSTLPVFTGYDDASLVPSAQACGAILGKDKGLDKVLELIAGALPPSLSETAYALAVEVAAADLRVQPEETRFLELLADRLNVSRLVTAAIERGAKARHRVA